MGGPGRRGCLAPLALLAAGLTIAVPANALDPQKSLSQFSHTSWSAKDGIPGPVRAIAQGRDGYLWLGTEAGLYRFDGLRFIPWEPTAGERLPSSAIWSMCTARDGSLWIGFGSGAVSRLRDGRLRNYSPAEVVRGGGILSLAEDGNGAVWAAARYGFSRFSGRKWQGVGKELGYPAAAAQSLLVDRRGNLWVATDGLNFGLGSDPVRANTILTLAPGAKRFAATGQAVGMVWTMAEAPDGEVWIADTTGRTARPLDGRRRPQAAVATGAESMCLLFDGDRSLWIGLIEGGIRRSADRQRLDGAALDRFQTSDGLSGGLVYAAFKDREGNVWFGTAGGLDRFRENRVTSFSAAEGLVPDQQLALAAARDGSVWIVSNARDVVQRVLSGRIVATRLPAYSRSDSARILSLYADRNGEIWLGGNFKLARETGGRFSYVPGADSDHQAMVDAIADDAAGNLWITQFGGDSAPPHVLRLRHGAWTAFGASSGLPGYRCRAVHGDAAGRVWLGFEDGEVAVYEGGAFRVYAAKDGLPDGRVLTITSDRAGRVWIGGEGGLSRFDHGRFVTLTRDNGLPGSSVAGIVEDDDGFLWLAGSLAILRVRPQELEKAATSLAYRLHGEAFDATDGLRGLPRQREPYPTAARAADGRLWFATTGGVAVIDPRRLPRNLVPPPVTIEAVAADAQMLAAVPGLRLRPHTRELEFHYAALSLTAPERVRFLYKLEGYDDRWHGPIGSREIRFTNLAPRSYRFRLVACNNDGVWNAAGAALGFSIMPAYYQTGWFGLLCAIAAGCLAWAGYRWRVRQLAARLDLRFAERLAERTRIAQDLHDTLLQGLLSAAMQLHVAHDQVAPESPAKPLVARVLELMRRVSDEGRNAVRGLRAPASNSLDLAEAFARVPQQLGGEAAIGFRVIAAGQQRPLQPLIRDEVYRIGWEALANAFRHSQASEIEVELDYAAHHLRLLVRDNGRGIDASVLRAGRDGHWGLSGMRERAEALGASFKVLSRPAAGTEILLSVPGPIAFQHRPPDRRLADRLGRWWRGLYPRRAGAGDAATGKRPARSAATGDRRSRGRAGR